MKSTARFLALLLIMTFAFSSFAEEPEVETSLQEKYEQRVFKCLETLTKCLSDDMNVYGTKNEFVRDSAAWNILAKFDGGWFPDNFGKTMKNMRTDGWVKVSDTEFCVNAYCDYEVAFLRNQPAVVYPCAYHLCLTQTDVRRDTWMVKDFQILENPNDKAFCEQMTNENAGITVTPVMGKTFTGFMMVIDDPSRVFVGTIPRLNSSSGGLRMHEIVRHHNALGGINGGAFSEGNGGSSRPTGIVYSIGQTLQAHAPNIYMLNTVIGFDENNKLHVGKYTVQEVDALHLRDALCFGPALIIDGESQDTGDVRNEYSSRTAIGQDAEGRVLMLVTRGRQPDSVGANMKDLIKIMEEYGAVTAGNLDGGHSTAMYLNETIVYSGFRLESSRTLPAGFLIKK